MVAGVDQGYMIRRRANRGGKWRMKMKIWWKRGRRRGSGGCSAGVGGPKVHA